VKSLRAGEYGLQPDAVRSALKCRYVADIGKSKSRACSISSRQSMWESEQQEKLDIASVVSTGCNVIELA
jgi:hypothetical protein